ncbi:hypothetical protein [Nocardia sp. CY41]|uniref:hypothetical protein n=1 Tax=Nocardia sp. CY41 TaxID=2608686 RepID=UPI00135C7F41|nr:hypothetical protein [Nocardia sp. CY41]
MSRTLVAWHDQPQLKAVAVVQMQRIAAYSGFRQGGQVLQDGRVGGGLHVCLCAQRLAEEQGVPVSVVLAAKDTVSWLDESTRLWGIPRVVGGLMDRCFERLAAHEAGRFAVAAIEAIPAGADLHSLGAQWTSELLADPREGVLRYTAEGSIQHRAVNQVIDLYRRTLAGDDPAPAEWTTAAQAAAQAAALADADEPGEPAGPPSCAAHTANLAAVAFAPDLVPMQVQVAAMRAATTVPDADAEAYHTAYLQTEAFAQAAHQASETVRAAADASFQTVLRPLQQAAERARTAERHQRRPDPRDAAALRQVRDAADTAAAACTHHYRWRANQLIESLTTAHTTPRE